MSILTDKLAEDVVAAVKEAGALLTERGGVREIRAKRPTDFVTNVDFAVQELLRARLSALAGEAQFMGEEQDNFGIDPARPVWILDPVDGTTNLIRNLRHSAVSLALAEGARVVFGAVYNPYAPELFTARLGGGAYLNGRRISVSGEGRLARSLVSVGTAPGRREWSGRVFAEMRALYDRAVDVRRSGCASLDLCDTACVRLDAYVERWLMPWDYAAGLLLIQEAGGTVTDLSGRALDCTAPSSVLASNGLIHGELEAILSPGPQGIEQDADKDKCPQGTP